MSENNTSYPASSTPSIARRLGAEDPRAFLITLAYGLLASVIVVLVSYVPQPFTMMGVFKFGIVLTFPVIAATGAFRGPVAGLMAGFIGTLAADLILYHTVVTSGLVALAYGILGFVAGIPSYEFDNGRSLLKLSAVSIVGLLFATLVRVLVGLLVENYATLVAIAYVLLPMLTMGIPSVFLLTPVLARVWHILVNRFTMLSTR